MGEREAASTRADLEALKAMQADISELEHSENLLDRFNVFEAIGFIGQELMHSRPLAFLLDPNESHGLGTSFLEVFLQKLSESTDSVSLPSGGSDWRPVLAGTLVGTWPVSTSPPTEIYLRTKRTFPSVMEQCARYWMESSMNLNPGQILSKEKQGAWHPMFVGLHPRIQGFWDRKLAGGVDPASWWRRT